MTASDFSNIHTSKMTEQTLESKKEQEKNDGQ